ncbi:MAG TPA: MBL fold metallo-hydrolase, partial [Chloroflexota bacterium]
YYMLKYGDKRPSDVSPRLPVWLPPGGHAFMERLGMLIGDKTEMLEDVFELQDYAADRELAVGSLRLSFHPVQHYILSHAMRIRASNGATLVFSSDVAPCPQLVDAARGADLFLCESAMLDATQDEPDPARRGHLSAREAGEAAQAAGVKDLLITHYRSSEKHDAHHLKSARQTFEGRVELAREGATYTVG